MGTRRPLGALLVSQSPDEKHDYSCLCLPSPSAHLDGLSDSHRTVVAQRTPIDRDESKQLKLTPASARSQQRSRTDRNHSGRTTGDWCTECADWRVGTASARARVRRRMNGGQPHKSARTLTIRTNHAALRHSCEWPDTHAPRSKRSAIDARPIREQKNMVNSRCRRPTIDAVYRCQRSAAMSSDQSTHEPLCVCARTLNSPKCSRVRL